MLASLVQLWHSFGAVLMQVGCRIVFFGLPAGTIILLALGANRTSRPPQGVWSLLRTVCCRVELVHRHCGFRPRLFCPHRIGLPVL